MRGPFSARHVTRWILLGRIRLEDQLSADRETWQVVETFTSLLPPELADLSNWDNYQQLVVSRMLVDERKGERRGSKPAPAAMPERRSGVDRRRNNDSEFVARHLFQRDFSYLAERSRSRHLRTLLLALLLATLCYAWLGPRS